MPYAVAQHMPDALFPPGPRHYWKSSFLRSLGDGGIDTILARFASVPSPGTLVIIEHGVGAVSRVDPDATAFGHRGWSSTSS